MRFSAKWGQYYPLTISRMSRKSLEPNSRKVRKGLILGTFSHIFPNFGKTRIFFKNPALSVIFLYRPPIESAISKESLEPLLRSRVTHTHTHPLCFQNIPQLPLRIDRAPGQLWTHISRERRKQSRCGFHHSKENSELPLPRFWIYFSI